MNIQSLLKRLNKSIGTFEGKGTVCVDRDRVEDVIVHHNWKWKANTIRSIEI
jgi:hypothetical protein